MEKDSLFRELLGESGISLCMACFLSAVHLFGLTWQLQPAEGQLYENGVSKGNRGTESMDTTYSPIGGKVSDKSEKKGTVIKMID